ncbi:hypothetical protein ACOSP7_020910 [Xanthoceras sorbifolium]
MNSLRTNPPEKLQHMSGDEIYDYIIGESPSDYIRKLGAGPKPRPSFGVAACRSEELTTVKTELAETRSNFNEQMHEIQAQLRDNFKIFFFWTLFFHIRDKV